MTSGVDPAPDRCSAQTQTKYNECREVRKMQLKKDCTYQLVMPTSMGVRITPFDRQPVHTGNLYTMQATSAESNVGNIAASLGMRVKLLTTFVKNSEIAQYIKSELRRRNLEYEGPEVPQGGPWGYRHQFNIADSGYGMRGPRVLNDRAGTLTWTGYLGRKALRSCTCPG
jgi:2-dehydro-3-deoxygluconokinase